MTDAQQPAAGPGAAEVDTSPAGAALPTETENASASVPSADRPRPAPSPTSRARRAAAAGVASAAAPVRRPSPVPADGGGAANPSTTAEPTNPKESETKPADGKVSVTKRSGTEPIDASDALQADQARQPHRVRTRSPRWPA